MKVLIVFLMLMGSYAYADQAAVDTSQGSISDQIDSNCDTSTDHTARFFTDLESCTEGGFNCDEINEDGQPTKFIRK